ncbi:16799_t:CDS:2, partial [Cetraspora pellucida]
MPPLPTLLNDCIVKSNIKINQSNLQTYCKYCINALGKEQEKRNYFPNKKDRIILHLKKCPHFLNATTAEKQAEIFELIPDNNSSTKKKVYNKRSSDSSRKVVVRSEAFGPIDNYAVRALSKENAKQFNKLLLKMTVSCEWSLFWVNNPEAKACFKFLNLLLVLSDRRKLGNQVLTEIVNETNKNMEIALKKDKICITLTYDRWTNVKNEHLLGTVLLSSEGKPYVWKAINISSERENYQEVINKTESMLLELELIDIKVYVIVTDSAGAYVAA